MSTRCNICGRQPPGIAGHGRTAAAVFGANRRYHLAMPSIWEDGARASLVCAGPARSPPTISARWGKLSVAGMLAHVNDATRMALGELPVQAKAPPFLKIAPVRYLVIHVLPFPRSAPTAPELLVRCGAADLASEQATFATLVERLNAAAPTLAAAPPRLRPDDATRLGGARLPARDHHLRQFGV